jgi:serine/threonine protein phosphatase PrpC
MRKILYNGKSDIGLVRKINEDIFVVEPDAGFCLVADGMGGAAAGEVASRIFSESALEVFLGDEIPSKQKAMDNVQKTFRLANENIFDHVTRNPLHQGMGCTAELIAFFDTGFVLGHIGDSRTYRVRDGLLKQLTKDHSLVQHQIDHGLITQEQARDHSLRNIILRAVGTEENLALDLINGNIYPGDIFLLCSDGLTDMVDDDLILQNLISALDLSQKTEKLIDLANSAGGKDNITAVLIEIQ